jgi:hypothetical protein
MQRIMDPRNGKKRGPLGGSINRRPYCSSNLAFLILCQRLGAEMVCCWGRDAMRTKIPLVKR